LNTLRWLVLLGVTGSAMGLAQNRAADLPTGELLSTHGPTFRISDKDLGPNITLIIYGDMRFTDPANVTATNPRIRKWLVDHIAAEHPSAVLLNGDVPLAGSNVDDYRIFKEETKPWRDAGLRVFPALGNHEFHGPDAHQCLENWWNTFPTLRNRRWYSTQLGSRIYAITVDSDASLLPESDQYRWLSAQLQELPSSEDFVIISMHHPPVADIQTHIEVDHNPRPNEIALRGLLSNLQTRIHARIIVSAGHIHNYERHMVNGVVYLVSGGGGAKPYFVERTPEDLYRSNLFPNYHYVKLTLNRDRLQGKMYRITDPEAAQLTVQEKDSFEVASARL
jgi:calcineurin-like phosphoesterase family protein